jgi:hypothetical protein
MNTLFKEYESKPVKRLAYRIKEGDSLYHMSGDQWHVVVGSFTINFKAHETVHVGDYVVYLTDTDTYHCSDKVFRERNLCDEAGMPKPFEEAEVE